MNSARPVQFVFPFGEIDPELPLVYVDVKRCRRSCLVESTVPWPVFCAHDEVVTLGNDLRDFNWIDKGKIQTARRKLKSLPYQGPRWYSKQATQWLLMRGVITWNDVKFGLTATAHLPPNTFQEPQDQIEKIMNPEFAKKAINSLLGIWTVDTHYSYVVATQHDKHAMNHGGR